MSAPISSGPLTSAPITSVPIRSSPGTSGASERSLGELVASATADISTLMRKEVELAKFEVKREVKQAGIGAGAFGAAGFTGLLALLFLSVALAFGISKILGDHVGLGFLIVGVLYLVVAAIAGLIGKKSLSKVGKPEKTIETVKDDIDFVKHPTVAPTRKAGSSV